MTFSSPLLLNSKQIYKHIRLPSTMFFNITKPCHISSPTPTNFFSEVTNRLSTCSVSTLSNVHSTPPTKPISSDKPSPSLSFLLPAKSTIKPFLNALDSFQLFSNFQLLFSDISKFHFVYFYISIFLYFWFVLFTIILLANLTNNKNL